MARNPLSTFKKILAGVSIGLLAALLAITVSHQVAAPLRWEPEGLYHSYNFRDVGQSLNSCLGRPFFKEGVLSRSNKFFSGWSCASIGKPTRIISLNYDPKNGWVYFCRDSDTINKGVFFNASRRIDEEQLYRLESWQDQEFRRPLCQTMQEILNTLAQRRSVHIHCNAGRDRTGSVVGMVVAALLEFAPMPIEHVEDLIECDYRKSRTLPPSKYGNISSLLNDIKQQHGTVHQFLIATCGFEESRLKAAATYFYPTSERLDTALPLQE